MKRFRIAWIAVVLLFALIFLGYRINEIRKADSSGPVFSCDQKEIEVSIQDGDEMLLQGVTAYDRKDGDVTDSILVEKLSAFRSGSRRTATYAAFDSDNHISEMEREIIYTDYTSPRFQLTGSLRFRTGQTINVDQIIRATDCLDGDISNKVKIHMDSSINNRVTGQYRIEYEVSNSAGDTVTLPVEVEIYQAESGEVDLTLDQYLVYYDGKDIDYKSYLRSIQTGSMEIPFEGSSLKGTVTEEEPEGEGSDEETVPEDSEEAGDGEDEEKQTTQVSSTTIPRSRVTVRADVNTAVPGVYPVYFYYRDDSLDRISYEATEVLYVVVEE